MKSAVGVYFTVERIVALVIGILLCITIFGAIIGVPLIIASNRFGEASKMTDEQLVQKRGNLLGWGVFTAIVFAPTIIGLILLLCLTMMVDNYIKNIELGNVDQNQKSFAETVEMEASNAWNGLKNTFSNNRSDLDKQKAELQKLEAMREEGLITADEYDALRKKILGI